MMNDAIPPKLLASKKYRQVCPDTLQRIWSECQMKYKKPKDAEKAAREALHGITGAFLTPEETKRCREAMERWRTEGQKDDDLAAMLDCHASTRERLPLKRMDEVFARIFEATGKPDSVLDLACGIDPLYLGARGIPTFGVDISGASVEMIQTFHESCNTPVRARCADLLCGNPAPNETFHTALLFKVLPLLERQRTGAAAEVMHLVRARHLVISFPTKTLSGRSVGMETHYSEWMENHLPEERRVAARFTADNELFYILA